MADAQISLAAVLTALAGDPGFRDFGGADAALLLWELDGSRLLWASPAAAGLREALAEDEQGRVGASFPARVQLRALGQGLAPSSGARLERLRFDRSRLTAPITCACRRITLPSGETVLVTALLSPVPQQVRRVKARTGSSVSASMQMVDTRAEPASRGSSENPVDPLARLPGMGIVRFLWHTDGAGRFTYISEALAKVVGAASAAVVGHTWDDIVGELVVDPAGVVSGLFETGKTWSGQTVLWRIADTDRAVSVDLAGAPLFSRDRKFLGFRGFGLCRTDTLCDWRPASGRDASIRRSGLISSERDSRPVPLRRSPPSPPTKPAKDTPVLLDQNGPSIDNAPVPYQPRAEDRSFPHLSAEERAAFREIARALGARFDAGETPADPTRPPAEVVHVKPKQLAGLQAHAALDQLPLGILVYRDDIPLFANRLFLDLAGYENVPALARDGGVPRLFPARSHLSAPGEYSHSTILATRRHESLPVEVHQATLQWDRLPASVMVVRKISERDPAQRLHAIELEARANEARLRELTAVLDTATDGVVMIDDLGRILSLNRSAEALFGYDQKEIAGESFIILLASESRGIALDYLDGLRSSRVANLLNDGRDVLGRVRQGGTIPLFMTIGRTSEGPERKFCMVLRDATALKKAEAELLAAKRVAEHANVEKSDFLAKVSHELRTPLSAILGFAEVMMEERFGPMANDRYRDYLKDIHDSGRRVVRLVGDLLDLANIEAGRTDLSFKAVNLNDVVASCVKELVQNATRERIVIRTSFAANLPSVVADERSLRQIVTNIVSNAVKFTHAGGQIIVSTAFMDRNEVVIRVRDTGIGMTDREIETALEPLRQIATARKGSGSGLGLPLAKALIEANRGFLHISSTPNEGTLVEIAFPPARVLADKSST